MMTGAQSAKTLVGQLAPQASVPPPGMALRMGTVTSPTGSDPGDTHALIDGDLDPIPVLSLFGAANEGERVVVLFWPPQGAYVIGRVGTPNASQWIDVEFNTGWSNFGGAAQTVQYRKEGDWVHLRGTAQRTSGAASLIFTLPVGFRPAARENFAADSDPQEHANISVDPSGTVEWFPSTLATAAYVSVSGIAFCSTDFL